jgi:hypothetical protein
VKLLLLMLGFKELVKGRVAELEMDPKLKEAGWERYAEFKIWFDQRLDAAIKKVKTLSLVKIFFCNILFKENCFLQSRYRCTTF